ncbi:MAG: hypothetical protein ACI9MC_000320 [Kiritimatiellia bacterium]|jgi:hypothetical protein
MREPKIVAFAVLDLLQAALIGSVPLTVPSGAFWIDGTLWLLAGCMAVAAPMLVFGGRVGRIYGAVVCLLYWLAGAVLAALVASSAGYLYGIYGGIGQALGIVAWVVVALVALMFWFMPLHQLAWLRKRGMA